MCVLLIEKEIIKAKKSTELFWNGVFWSVILGIAGARFYYVIGHLEIYMRNPLQIFAIWNGGLVILGAILSVSAYLYLYLKKNNEDFFWWFDKIALYMPLGQALGRLANIYNQELLPFAYYEGISSVVLFAILFSTKNFSNKSGTTAALYLIGYALVRIFLEPLRQDQLLLGEINLNILFSAFFVLAGIIALWKIHKSKQTA